jgi:hypothetical protein
MRGRAPVAMRRAHVERVRVPPDAGRGKTSESPLASVPGLYETLRTFVRLTRTTSNVYKPAMMGQRAFGAFVIDDDRGPCVELLPHLPDFGGQRTPWVP